MTTTDPHLNRIARLARARTELESLMFDLIRYRNLIAAATQPMTDHERAEWRRQVSTLLARKDHQ